MAILRDQPFDIPRNPTYIPDIIYDTLSPIVLFRNPIIHITSLHRDLLNGTQIRPGDETFTLTTSLAFTRHLYDQLRDQGRNPILIDAEDLLWRTQELGEKLCAALGIENVLSEKWDPTPEDQRPTHPAIAQWTKDIHESNGILRPATKVSPITTCTQREFTNHVLSSLPNPTYKPRSKNGRRNSALQLHNS